MSDKSILEDLETPRHPTEDSIFLCAYINNGVRVERYRTKNSIEEQEEVIRKVNDICLRSTLRSLKEREQNEKKKTGEEQ